MSKLPHWTDWEKIQLYITSVIIATAIVGLGVLFVMWIAP